MVIFGKRRIVQSISVTLALSLMSGVAYTATSDTATSVSAAGNTAGIVSTVDEMQSSAYLNASVESSDVTVVAASEDDATESEWTNRLMADVDEFLYVRAAADSEAEIVGKLRTGDVAEVTGSENGWYAITSGNVTGYVSADYCVTGDDAYALALEVCTTYAKATSGGIRVRSEASEDSSIMTVLGQDDTIEADLDAESVDGWVAVICDGETCYVSADYVTVYTDYGEAITLEEEQEAVAAAAAAAAAAKAQAVATQNAAIAASTDDTTLLAALIQCEAGSESYEGKVAVGAVVVNRVRSGSYPSSVYAVIYQSGQFSPAASGSVASVVASGPSSSCMEAAAQALSGYDNTGGALGFAPTRTGKSGVVIGNHVFY